MQRLGAVGKPRIQDYCLRGSSDLDTAAAAARGGQILPGTAVRPNRRPGGDLICQAQGFGLQPSRSQGAFAFSARSADLETAVSIGTTAVARRAHSRSPVVRLTTATMRQTEFEQRPMTKISILTIDAPPSQAVLSLARDTPYGALSDKARAEWQGRVVCVIKVEHAYSDKPSKSSALRLPRLGWGKKVSRELRLTGFEQTATDWAAKIHQAWREAQDVPDNARQLDNAAVEKVAELMAREVKLTSISVKIPKGIDAVGKLASKVGEIEIPITAEEGSVFDLAKPQVQNQIDRFLQIEKIYADKARKNQILEGLFREKPAAPLNWAPQLPPRRAGQA